MFGVFNIGFFGFSYGERKVYRRIEFWVVGRFFIILFDFIFKYDIFKTVKNLGSFVWIIFNKMFGLDFLKFEFKFFFIMLKRYLFLIFKEFYIESKIIWFNE